MIRGLESDINKEFESFYSKNNASMNDVLILDSSYKLNKSQLMQKNIEFKELLEKYSLGNLYSNFESNGILTRDSLVETIDRPETLYLFFNIEKNSDELFKIGI